MKHSVPRIGGRRRGEQQDRQGQRPVGNVPFFSSCLMPDPGLDSGTTDPTTAPARGRLAWPHVVFVCDYGPVLPCSTRHRATTPITLRERGAGPVSLVLPFPLKSDRVADWAVDDDGDLPRIARRCSSDRVRSSRKVGLQQWAWDWYVSLRPVGTGGSANVQRPA